MLTMTWAVTWWATVVYSAAGAELFGETSLHLDM